MFFSLKLNNLSIILLALVFITSVRNKIEWKVFNNLYFYTYLFYCVICVVSCFLSDNLLNGIKVLERKATFLIFPFIVILCYKSFSKVFIQTILKLFIFISVLIFIFSIIYSIYLDWNEVTIGTLFRDNLCRFTKMHPPYLALYLSFAGLCSLFFLFENMSIKSNCFYSVMVLISITANILLETRITFFALVICMLIYVILKTKKVFISMVVTIVMLVIACLIFINSPFLSKRYREIAETKIAPPIGIYHNSVNLRVAHWLCAYQLITDNSKNFILGVGLGDSQDEMNICYKRHNWSDVLYKLNYDCRSQLLQSFLEKGIIGLLTILLMIFLPIYYCYKNNDYLAIVYFLLIFFCSLTESIFNSQKGIVLFTFFSSFLVVRNIFKDSK